ncbi:TPA: hypothetical protein ACNVUO_005241 [Escherichia coli]
MADLYAVVENRTVVNVIVWDGIDLDFGDDIEAIRISAGAADIGWLYTDGQFTAPPPPELSEEELAQKNMALAQTEYNVATAKITALNEQIEDADYAGTTEDEVRSALTAWTDYRKQLRAYIKVGDGRDALPPQPDN